MRVQLGLCTLLLFCSCTQESGSGRVPFHHFRKVDPQLGTQFLAIYLSPDEITLSRDNPPAVGTSKVGQNDVATLELLFSDEHMATYQEDSILGDDVEHMMFEPPALTPPAAGPRVPGDSDCACESAPCPCPPEMSNEQPPEVRYYISASGRGLMIFGSSYSDETARMLRAHEEMYGRYHEAIFGRQFE